MRRKAGACVSLGALCALALASPVSAAPRDAIRDLPALTYTGEFTRRDPAEAGQPVRDDFYSTLDIDWAPPQKSLKGGVNFKHSWHTRIAMKDNLDQTAGLSSDNRYEELRYTLRLDKPGVFGMSYGFNRGDNWNSSGQGRPSAAWDSWNEKNFNFNLNLNNLPSFSMFNQVKDSYSPPNARLGNGSTTEFNDYKLNFKRDAGTTYTEFNADVQSTQTRTFNVGQANDRSSSIVAFDAVRALQLGGIGRLQLAGHYDESSSTSLEGPRADSTGTSAYQLDLTGGLASLPANYGLTYRVFNQDYPDVNFLRTVERRLRFDIRPPMPAGKSSGITIADALAERQDRNYRSLVNTQGIAWRCQVNPRTSGILEYARESDMDLLSELETKRVEGSRLNLNYNIPGQRGSLSAFVSQGSTVNPTLNSKSSDSTLSLSNSLQLGERASASFNLSQSYSNVGNVLLINGSTDTLATGFTYNLYSQSGYSLAATWGSRLQRLDPAGTRTMDDTFTVDLSWRPQPAWAYIFHLETDDGSSLTTGQGGNLVYKTSDLVNVKVVYTF